MANTQLEINDKNIFPKIDTTGLILGDKIKQQDLDAICAVLHEPKFICQDNVDLYNESSNTRIRIVNQTDYNPYINDCPFIVGDSICCGNDVGLVVHVDITGPWMVYVYFIDKIISLYVEKSYFDDNYVTKIEDITFGGDTTNCIKGTEFMQKNLDALSNRFIEPRFISNRNLSVDISNTEPIIIENKTVTSTDYSPFAIGDLIGFYNETKTETLIGSVASVTKNSDGQNYLYVFWLNKIIILRVPKNYPSTGIVYKINEYDFTNIAKALNQISNISIPDMTNVAYTNKDNNFTAYQTFASGAGNSGSDMRFKTNIKHINKGILEKLMQLDIISYKWCKKDEPELDTFGINANQLRKFGGLFEKIVHERLDEDKTLWVEYDRFGILAIKGIQELERKRKEDKRKLLQTINKQQTRIEELERENQLFARRLKRLEKIVFDKR